VKTTLTILFALSLGMSAVGDEMAKKRFEETKAKAEKGEAVSQYNLGVMYDNGRGVPKDYKEAVKWFRKAAEQGHAKAHFNLGVMYLQWRRRAGGFRESLCVAQYSYCQWVRGCERE
jgi:TPR repeat protein